MTHPTLQDAFALHRQGRLAEAARLYEAIAAREPKNAQARQYLGVILLSAGRPNEAKALMKRALELKPNEIDYLENYIGALVITEDFDEALELSRNALARQPRNANILYLNAISLQKLDRLDEARAAFVALLQPRAKPSGGPHWNTRSRSPGSASKRNRCASSRRSSPNTRITPTPISCAPTFAPTAANSAPPLPIMSAHWRCSPTRMSRGGATAARSRNSPTTTRRSPRSTECWRYGRTTPWD